MNRANRRPTLLLVVVAIAVAGLAAAQTIDPANEGYDPMRQISTQFVRPNIMLVFDVSGSMAWDEVNSHDVGVDSTGTWLTATWSKAGSGDCNTGRTQCTVWTATLTVRQTHPSRMANVKNVLGNSVNIITPWTPPGGTCTAAANQWPTASWSGGTIVGPTARAGDPTTSNTYWEYQWTWRITATSRIGNPGDPFSATLLTSQPPTIGCDCVSRAAADLVGKSADKVNWGLEIYSGVAANCSAATLVYPPKSAGAPDARAIEACLKTNKVGTSANTTVVDSVTYQGLFASSGTPTKAAMGYALSVLTAVAGGGTVTNYNGTYNDFPAGFKGKSFTITADPKLVCGRTYATILVTDGLSNTCNPGSGGNWAEPCLTCTKNNDPGCPDGGPSGYTCPSPYPTSKTLQLTAVDGFLAEKADALWWLTVGGRRVKARTWVVGVSDAVGPCELNYTAYRGRTDANATEGDTGFDTALDPYLPEGTPGNYDSPTCNNHTPPHGNYAFFPKTAAQLESAFAEILGAIGTGDYTTAAPTVTSAPLDTEGGMIGFVSSASYPKWLGHLYAYDLTADCSNTTYWNCTQACGWIDPNNAARKSNCLWDAGEVLSLGALNQDGTRKALNNGVTRRLYTWNPASNDAMVAITAANASTLNTLCGNCGITSQVVDFMQGNNGSGGARAWRLGAIINSTQAVIGPPVTWKQNRTESHSAFEDAYKERHQIVWAGSSDGFIHAFDAVDGAELVALIPPDQLSKQVSFYTRYLTKPSQLVTGEPKLPSDHVYGVANSPRFGDVYFASGAEYKTVLFATDGPGGKGIAALDVTHPFAGRDYNGDGDQLDDAEAADANYGFGAADTTTEPPVRAVWSKTRSDLGSLGYTWSVPAIGASDRDSWELLIGGGFDETLTTSSAPTVYRLDPVDGRVNSTESISNQSTGAYVRNQAFADSVLWEKNAPYFQQDNLVSQGVQADLQGQLWTFEPNNWNPSRLYNAGSAQPFYYSPAVAAYPATATPAYHLYAYASGSFYEKSPNVTGTSSTFVPRIYITAVNRSSGVATTQYLNLTSIPKPTGETGNLGSRAQVTAPPMIFVAKGTSTADPFALFLVYDPDAGTCVGTSYIVRVGFAPVTLSSITVPASQVYSAGAGASAGFAIAGTQVIVSHSYVGEDGRASLVRVPNLEIPPGDLSGAVAWWMEIQ